MKSPSQISASETLNLVSERRNRISRLGNVEHRLEYVDRVNGVEYINDAKSSDVNSTWYLLDNINQPVIWIMSSSQLENEMEAYADIDLEKVRAMIIMGSNQEALKNVFSERIELIGQVNTMMEAVEHAQLIANEGEVVLFSPACSDYDTFKNFKDAGQQFRKAVREVRL
jgi:UDP-N-acetylmuramoylalanine--D-glutamate ligase